MDRNNLRVMRKRVGMTSEQLGNETGISGGTIRKYECGILDLEKISIIKLATICKVLDCRASELFPKGETRNLLKNL